MTLFIFLLLPFVWVLVLVIYIACFPWQLHRVYLSHISKRQGIARYLLCSLLPVTFYMTFIFGFEKLMNVVLISEEVVRAFLILTGIGLFIVALLMVIFLMIIFNMKVKDKT
jgi:hypothetical protein